MDLVSVIVPVYNVEKYVGDCVSSILNQTYKNIEVLLIDDGSGDWSGQIIDCIAAKDNRVVVFHLKNGGVAQARNYGIHQAKGKYLAFVDGDDQMAPDFLEKAVNAIRNAEYVSGAFETVNEKNERHMIDYMAAYEAQVSCGAYLKKMIEYQAGAYWGANWGKLYIAGIVKNNHIEFETNISFAEDFRFNIQYLMYVRTISLIHIPTYYYRIDTQSSLSKKAREPLKYWEEYYELYNRYIQVYQHHNIYKEVELGISKFLLGAYLAVLRVCVYQEKMKLKDATKICTRLDGNVDVQKAATRCVSLNGKTGIYAKLISTNHSKLIVIAMKVARWMKW